MYNVNFDTTNNTIQDVTGDSLTGDLARFMAVLIANANRVFPGVWSIGQMPESTEGDVTMSFGESDNCLAVLQSLCEKFNVEFPSHPMMASISPSIWARWEQRCHTRSVTGVAAGCTK